MALRALSAALAAVAALALGAGPAQAASSVSSNWAGYAVRRSGVQFRRVSATWAVPRVSCVAGRRTSSANWVGLGGYSASARALEQLGTESDCTAAGHQRTSAWFEVVPDVAHTSSLRVHAGDTVSASATVRGTQVMLRLADRTTGRTAQRVIRAATVDLTSAEWITEAPSLCTTTAVSTCTLAPLADFGTTSFADARATTTTGRTGTIGDPAWTPVSISLSQASQGHGGGRFDDVTAAGVGASPGALSATGDGFAIQYATAATAPSTTLSEARFRRGTAVAVGR